MSGRLTSLERVLTALGHREADRVPRFILATLLGARELGMSIQEYFRRAENVVEAEMRFLKRYRNDCVCSFFYAAVETEAWGGKTFFRDDGPPTTDMPLIEDVEEVASLELPDITGVPAMREVIKATRMLKERVGGETPIIGVIVSPFSLPVMQLGFDRYIEMLYERRDLFEKLMWLNEEFCVEWANAQFSAGVTVMACLDPVASPTIIPRELYLETGFPVARRTLARFQGPSATHMASGRSLPIIDDLAATGTAAVGVSATEDLAEVKRACRGKLTILGNLNGIEMRHWTPAQAEAEVKAALAKAGPGGGFILSDNHGEIPWQVSDETLLAICEVMDRWGNYPLDWIDDEKG